MPSCSIRWCGKSSKLSNYKKDGITFHRFPKIPEIKEKWINAVKRDNWFPAKHSVICSRHFAADCFEPLKDRRRLFSSATPTLFIPALTPQLPPDEMPTRYPSPSITPCTPAMKSSAKDASCSTKSQSTYAEESDPLADLPEAQVVIANVYQYLEMEFQFLKSECKCCDLTPLGNVLERTAKAAGVSQRIVSLVLGDTGTRHHEIEFEIPKDEKQLDKSQHGVEPNALPGNQTLRKAVKRNQGSRTKKKQILEQRGIESNASLTERQVTVSSTEQQQREVEKSQIVDPDTVLEEQPEVGTSQRRIESASVSVKRRKVDQDGNIDPSSTTNMLPLIPIETWEFIVDGENETNCTVKQELIEDEINATVKQELVEDEYEPHTTSMSGTSRDLLSIAYHNAVFTPTEMQSHTVKSEPPED